MIDANGWFDWAERVPGHDEKVNGNRNPASGFVAHSAEGWEAYMRSNPPLPPSVGGKKSWHLSNLVDGRLLQHYSIYSQCWASGSTFPNNNYVAMEHEGVAGQPLTSKQTETTTRVLSELSTLVVWKPVRQVTLWEHNECTRWGSDPTACPSGRIPWEEILRKLQPQPTTRRRRDMSIIQDSSGAAYLVYHIFIAFIPSQAIYDDLHAMIYGPTPRAISDETMTWLRGQPTDDGQNTGARFVRVF